VYSSDLYRTMTTARAVYKPKGLPLRTRADLRELSMGDWEDRSWSSVGRQDPDTMALFMASSAQFRAPHGETFGELRQRGAGAILDIAAHHPDQTVAVFAHGTFIRCVLAEFLHIPQEEMHTMGHSDNTAVSKLEIQDGQVKVVYTDDNSHLTVEISTLAKQRWWNKDESKIDVNLWYKPFDMDLAADREFYFAGREEAWRNLYGNLDKFSGQGFLNEAQYQSRTDHRSLVKAMDGDKAIGILQLDLDRGAWERLGYITFLYLIPEERYNGLGVQLIGKAVSTYRPLGRDRLQLVCSEKNTPALAFYDRFGFYRTGTALGAYGPLYQLEKYIGYGATEGVVVG
jgi:probable phosphoglycerate mutase